MIPRDEVPDSLADVVRQAAAAIPAMVSDLGTVRRRHRQRRQRRVAMTAGLAALLVGAAASAAPMLTRAGSGDRSGPPVTDLDVPSPSGSTSAPPVRPAQRLLLPKGATLMTFGDRTSGLRYATDGVAEVLPDGRVVYHPLPAPDTSTFDAVPLADGRLVVTHNFDRTPGTQEPDGPQNPAYGMKLMVLSAGGSVELARDIHLKGETVTLVGATAREAYLLRSRGIVAHDLGTGAERPVLLTKSIFPPGSPDFAGGGLDISGGRLAMVGPACAVRVFDVATGQRVADLRPPAMTCWAWDQSPRGLLCGMTGLQMRSMQCFDTGEVRLSPDGSLVAIRHDVISADHTEFTQTRLAIMEVATGAVLVDRQLSRYEYENMGGSPVPIFLPVLPFKRFPAIGWSDTRTVQVAVISIPDRDKVHLVEEVLTVEVVTVS